MISLCLMTQKGFEVLHSLIQQNLHAQIDSVCIGEDKNIKNDYKEEIKGLCETNGIHYLFRADKAARETLDKSDYVIAVSWRWMLHLSYARLLVLHDSLLPKYRGFAPLVNALKNGEEELGVTAIIANNEYDRGDIILQKKVWVQYPLKIQDAIEKVGTLYSVIISEIFQQLKTGVLKARPQNDEDATYSLWLDDEDYCIDWCKSAVEIKRFVDATGYPYNGAKSRMGGEEIQIQDVEVFQDVEIENRTPGKVIFLHDHYPVVVCGKGLLKITAASYGHNNESILPYKKFRTRFT